MSAEIIRLNVVTKLDLTPDDVLRESIGLYPGGVFICGYDEDGNVQVASSIADGGSVLWMMEIAKVRLMTIAGEIESDR